MKCDNLCVFSNDTMYFFFHSLFFKSHEKHFYYDSLNLVGPYLKS